MPRVAILTPAREDEHFGGRWPEVLGREAAPLRAAGVEVEGRTWTEATDLAAFDLVLPLLAWGYHRQLAQWLDHVRGWEEAGVRLRNPASVLRWNADKSYLGRLAARGAPVVPTRYVDRIDAEILAGAAAAFGTERVVAKPVSSAGAWRTIRWPGDAAEDGPAGAGMIQPYLPSIESAGEVSMLFFGGRFSHAIVKRPQPGDYRVQPEYDGIITAHRPDADEFAAAEKVLGAIGEALLYARVDLVRGLSGRPELIEVEAIEPDLYLGHDALGGAAYAEALLAALS